MLSDVHCSTFKHSRWLYTLKCDCFRSRRQKLAVNINECYFDAGFLFVSSGVTFFGGYLILNWNAAKSSRCEFLDIWSCLLSGSVSLLQFTVHVSQRLVWIQLSDAARWMQSFPNSDKEEAVTHGGRLRLPVEQWDSILSCKQNLD